MQTTTWQQDKQPNEKNLPNSIESWSSKHNWDTRCITLTETNRHDIAPWKRAFPTQQVTIVAEVPTSHGWSVGPQLLRYPPPVNKDGFSENGPNIEDAKTPLKKWGTFPFPAMLGKTGVNASCESHICINYHHLTAWIWSQVALANWMPSCRAAFLAPQAAQDAPIFSLSLPLYMAWILPFLMALPDIVALPEPNGRRSQKEGTSLRLKKMASKDESRTVQATVETAESEPVAVLEKGEAPPTAASLKIPAHEKSMASTFVSSTRGSVWSSNRWLTECKAGLKATESKSWSQLLQSLTGEPVTWRDRPGGPRLRAPNQRRLVKKAVHGILLRRPHQSAMRQEDQRRFKKEASRESVTFDVEEEPSRENSIDAKTRKSSSIWAEKQPPEKMTDLHTLRCFWLMMSWSSPKAERWHVLENAKGP